MFVRFSGCNLRCPFCDTEFDSFQEMTADEVISVIGKYTSRFVVLTGGEPTLQVDEAFVDLLHRHGYEVAMESNGMRSAPPNIDWLTISPKVPKEQVLWSREKKKSDAKLPDEWKVIFDGQCNPEDFIYPFASCPSPHAPLLYLQPCDTGDEERNVAITAACVDYIKRHPEWRLSLQTHKLIGIE